MCSLCTTSVGNVPQGVKGTDEFCPRVLEWTGVPVLTSGVQNNLSSLLSLQEGNLEENREENLDTHVCNLGLDNVRKTIVIPFGLLFRMCDPPTSVLTMSLCLVLRTNLTRTCDCVGQTQVKTKQTLVLVGLTRWLRLSIHVTRIETP